MGNRRKAITTRARGSGGKFSTIDNRRVRRRKADHVDVSTSSDSSGVESRGMEEVWCESADDIDVCETAVVLDAYKIGGNIDALEVFKDIDIMEGANEERLDKFVKKIDKPFRPKDCDQSLYAG